MPALEVTHMASDENFLEFTHNGIEVTLRLADIIEIEVRAIEGEKAIVSVAMEDGVGWIRIEKERTQPHIRLVKH
jgi:hypothetical protein